MIMQVDVILSLHRLQNETKQHPLFSRLFYNPFDGLPGRSSGYEPARAMDNLGVIQTGIYPQKSAYNENQSFLWPPCSI